MTKRKRALIVFAVLLGFVSACTSRDEARRKAEVKSLLATHSGEERLRSFQAHSVDGQINLYLTGMRMKPPVTGLAYYLADQRDTVIPFLLDRLAREADESNQENLIFVFKVMAASGHHVPANATDLIASKVGEMKHSWNRERSQEYLTAIRSQR